MGSVIQSFPCALCPPPSPPPHPFPSFPTTPMHADAHSHTKYLQPSGKDGHSGHSGLNRLRERSAGLELPGSASTRGAPLSG